MAMVGVSAASFGAYYFSDDPDGFVSRFGKSPVYPYGWRDVLDFVRENRSNYDAVVVSHSLSAAQDYIYAAFYLPYPPGDFARDAEFRRNGPWIDVTRLGNFHFCDLRTCVSSIPGRKLIVAKSWDPPHGKLLKRVQIPGNGDALLIYET
jgi:hypothetical protein